VLISKRYRVFCNCFDMLMFDFKVPCILVLRIWAPWVHGSRPTGRQAGLAEQGGARRVGRVGSVGCAGRTLVAGVLVRHSLHHLLFGHDTCRECTTPLSTSPHKTGLLKAPATHPLTHVCVCMCVCISLSLYISNCRGYFGIFFLGVRCSGWSVAPK
jgi:hypothetical protein